MCLKSPYQYSDSANEWRESGEVVFRGSEVDWIHQQRNG